MGANAFGYGTTVPSLLLYLNKVHELSFTIVTLAVSFGGFAALLIGPLAYSAIDHVGASGAPTWLPRS